jgi:hypothetical protein
MLIVVPSLAAAVAMASHHEKMHKKTAEQQQCEKPV